MLVHACAAQAFAITGHPGLPMRTQLVVSSLWRQRAAATVAYATRIVTTVARHLLRDYRLDCAAPHAITTEECGQITAGQCVHERAARGRLSAWPQANGAVQDCRGWCWRRWRRWRRSVRQGQKFHGGGCAYLITLQLALVRAARLATQRRHASHTHGKVVASAALYEYVLDVIGQETRLQRFRCRR